MINIGIIGYGYWGPNLTRNFAENPSLRIEGISDTRAECLEAAARRYPGVRVTQDYHEICADPHIDAVAIATPVFTHFDIALCALKAGKHVLVEKPLAMTSSQCGQLIDEAVRRNRVLMVDHTFIYTGAVRKIKELLTEHILGKVYYYDSVRINLGIFQSDVNVLWDLAVHDLAIMDFLLGEIPEAVSATGTAHFSGEPENIAYLTCFFPKNLIAHFHVNWLAPVKIRRTLISGDTKMVVYDDLEPSEKVKVYDKSVVMDTTKQGMYQLLVNYRTGDMWAPKIDSTEALQRECRHFVDSIEKGTAPVTDGAMGLRVVRILEAASRSLAQKGNPVSIE